MLCYNWSYIACCAESGISAGHISLGAGGRRVELGVRVGGVAIDARQALDPHQVAAGVHHAGERLQWCAEEERDDILEALCCYRRRESSQSATSGRKERSSFLVALGSRL